MKPTKSYPYSVVFTTEPLPGNSLAVFPDASEFDTETMQILALGFPIQAHDGTDFQTYAIPLSTVKNFSSRFRRC